MNLRRPRRPALVVLLLVLVGCAATPPYQRPDIPLPGSCKEAPGWVRATPADAAERGPWWTVFADPVLGDLASRIEVTNQNVAAATAAYAQARALVAQQRASLLPTVSLDGGATRSGGEASGGARNSVRVNIGASWEPDVWGRLASGVRSAQASADASAADLAAARLSAQGELVLNYLGLRQADAQKALLEETLAGYQRTLQIVRNRYDAGIVARTDVLQAETQLANTQAEVLGLARSRAQYEHAIAVLLGRAPAGFSIARRRPGRPWCPRCRPACRRNCCSADPTSRPRSAVLPPPTHSSAARGPVTTRASA